MAHYKRGRCRYGGRYPKRSTSNTTFRKRKGLKPVKVPSIFNDEYDWNFDYWPEPWGHTWLNTWPRAHDILYHNRPRRRAEKLCEFHVKRGVVDLEDFTWPLSRKPHKYFW